VAQELSRRVLGALRQGTRPGMRRFRRRSIEIQLLVNDTIIEIWENPTITIEQRPKAFAFIRGFDKDFSLTSRNCVLFSSELANLVGLKTPRSSSFRTPVEYLIELRKLNPGK
jgi:hypothetical protein